MHESNLPVVAIFSNDSQKIFFVDLFGNSDGLPTIMISEDEPPQSRKKSGVLLKELNLWKTESINYVPDANIYLVSNFEYEDGSYDFRYFQLEDVIQEKSCSKLVAKSDESVELREHFAAFDESMFDTD